MPALIAVFEPAGTAVALQRYTEMVRPDRVPSGVWLELMSTMSSKGRCAKPLVA